MLKQEGIEYRYREYTQEPLSEADLRVVLGQLGVEPKAVFRTRDGKKLGLTGDEPADQLIAAMAENPTLLQRPIGVFEGRAAVGRPIENLVTLVRG